MRRRIAAILPALLAAGWLLSLFLPLLSPGRALASRDIPLFHLPLRTAFRHLAAHGLPVWNPWLHGGQPMLSNPSYAAFYPPSWAVFAVPPAYALNLLVLFHAGLAFAGAWRLARRLGAGRGAAALAAFGSTGSGIALSLLGAFTLFCSMAWFPWVLTYGDAALRAGGREDEGPERSGWLRPALLCGGALAMQLLNGEPVTVVVSGLGLLCLAATEWRRPRSVLRLAVPLAAALSLAAVQLLPTAGRLADSPRAGGLDPRQAATWSAPPARLVELIFPRFFGDPAEHRPGRYFGWGLHDRDFPYVASIYPGLLLTVLGVCALALWPVPRRGAWALAILLGGFLALGRHNSLFEGLRRAVPVLAVLRFPEKFALLTVSALVFAGALGWQRLMEERRAGRHSAADFPLALSGVLLATAGALAAALHLLPQAALWFIRRHGGPALKAADEPGALAYLRWEAWAALATAAAVTGLFVLCRARRPPERLLTAAAALLLAADLWHYGHGLVVTLPAAEYRDPPYLTHLLRPGSRLWVEPPPDAEPGAFSRSGDQRLAPVRALLARLTPYSGSLWGVAYAGNQDYDLMLTHWGSLTMTILDAERRQPDLARRFLGAWNVGLLFYREPTEQWAADLAGAPGALPVQAMANPYFLPRYRFPPQVSFHASFASAFATARNQGYALDRHEHAVREGRPPSEATYSGPVRPLQIRDEGGHIRLRYHAPSPAFFTVATTYDAGWRAVIDGLDGSPVPVYPTGACQLGVELPAGEHTLLLAYRDPLLPAGAAVSLAALAAWVVLLARQSRRP